MSGKVPSQYYKQGPAQNSVHITQKKLKTQTGHTREVTTTSINHRRNMSD